MRVLVIGGSGFIGSRIVGELLRRGTEVTVLHRGRGIVPSGAREVLGDRRRLTELSDGLRAVAPDVVVDVVLSSGRQAAGLMSVFRGHAGRVVALSSLDVYRACGVTHGLEEGPLEPLPLREENSPLRSKLQTYPPAQVRALQQIFGWLDDEYDKIPVEREILAHADLPGTVLRLPMVYGPGDPLHRFSPIVKRIVDGRRVLLLSSGMAAWRGTKGYVEDVAAAVAFAALSDRAAGRVYNVGESDALTELDWAGLVARALDWDGEFRLLPDDALPPHLRAPGNTAQHWVADTSRIREELGFRESLSREEAVRRSVAWERENPDPGTGLYAFDYSAEDETVART